MKSIEEIDQDSGKWVFDAEAAHRFTDEAEKNIPDYWKVIELTSGIVRENLAQNSRIIDVGCANGNTLSYLYKQGFRNLFGVDASAEMLEVARKKLAAIDRNFPARLFHSKTFIHAMAFDAIICNWTLHFIKEREEYLRAVFDSLVNEGLFILTEKTLQSQIIEQQYLGFKQEKGLSDMEISHKKKQLENVLVPLSVPENIELLIKVGFSHIEIINARLGFVTFLCIKSQNK